MKTLKRAVNFALSRLFLVGIVFLLQLFFIIFIILYYSNWLGLYILFLAFSIIVVVYIVYKDTNPYYKLSWVITILSFPVFGWILYFLFGNKRIPQIISDRMNASLEGMNSHISEYRSNMKNLKSESEHLYRQSNYIHNVSGFPVYKNSSSAYFPVGEDMFSVMAEKLKTAESFIMLEYFIISPGYMFDTIFKILEEKKNAGVDIYLIYDDVGSIGTLLKDDRERLSKMGINICVFNPIRPSMNVLFNFRDHRKIMVIDNKYAFCGGINIADEYINRIERFGHWKDTAIMLEGEAVWSFTAMFLQQWEFGTGKKIDYSRFKIKHKCHADNGFVQVFGDSPLDNYNVTEVAYRNIISRAKEYVYITTPYLVIDYEMQSALCCAAQSGVDVRIITPHKYDKWYIHLLTRSHYKTLMQAGVKIFEYTPGFIHSKMFVCDDDISMIGTCNMDFRSFNLHFECSATFYNAEIITEMKQDILSSEKVSHLITEEDIEEMSLPAKIITAGLKVFAPLL